MWTAHPGGEQGDGERFLEPVARSASDRTIMRMYWKRCPSISLRTAAISGSTALAVRRTSDTTRPDARVRRRLWQVGGYQIRKYHDLGITRHTGTGVRAKSFFTTKTFQPVTSKYFTGS